MHKEKIHNKESHGTSGDIDENTSSNKVNGPSLFERAKEEIEAFVDTIHSKMEHHPDPHEKKDEVRKDAKEDAGATTRKTKTHKKETHGTSNDIDENTPVEKVKGPNVFERAKEEIEALVEAFHPKKGSENK